VTSKYLSKVIYLKAEERKTTINFNVKCMQMIVYKRDNGKGQTFVGCYV